MYIYLINFEFWIKYQWNNLIVQLLYCLLLLERRVQRYQRGHQKQQEHEEGQTTQWPKEKEKRTNNNLQNI